MSKTIALFASARRCGNTGKFIDGIAAELDIEVIDLAQKRISPYDYEHKNIHDDFVPLVKELLMADNILFVTPVYWYGPSAQMKVFIDRCSDFLDVEELKEMGRELRQKTAYIVSTSISEDADEAFLSSLKNTFAYLGMRYGGRVHANCEDGYLPDNYQKDVAGFLSHFDSKKTM